MSYVNWKAKLKYKATIAYQKGLKDNFLVLLYKDKSLLLFYRYWLVLGLTKLIIYTVVLEITIQIRNVHYSKPGGEKY